MIPAIAPTLGEDYRALSPVKLQEPSANGETDSDPVTYVFKRITRALNLYRLAEGVWAWRLVVLESF